MGVTGHVTAVEPLLLEVEKLINGHTPHGSESLCKLLRYLADHAVKHPGSALKEYQIATEVFGRPADFDPHLDSLVRVQAGRLRAKLAEYYASEGSDDPIVVEMPKGSYNLAFHQATRTVKAIVQSAQENEPNRSTAGAERVAIAILTVLLVVASVIIVGLLSSRSKSSTYANAEELVLPHYVSFGRGS